MDRGRLAGEWVAQYAWTAQMPDLVHISSVFEGLDGEAVVPDLLGMPCTTVVSATAYDLIPLIFADAYLQNPAVADWYRSRLDRLRRCDVLLAISEATRRDLIAHLKIPADRVVTIHGAVDTRFHPAPVSARRREHLLGLLNLTKPYVMYTGGIDHRKNVEATIRGFGLLPAAIRDEFQMAIVCSISDGDRERLGKLIASCGLPEDSVMLTGFVAQNDLVDLYRCCELFVFPSKYEGFGLPVLEAMACGAPTIASDTSSLPEIIGRRDALFSIESDERIAEALAHALAEPDFRQSLRSHATERARLYSWRRVADRTQEAWADAIARKANRVSIDVIARRPRLAIVSPLHPERSGVANFVTDLLPFLAEHFQIDLFASSDVDSERYRAMGFGVHPWQALPGMYVDYDAGVVYQFGNSQFHVPMVALIGLCPGVAFVHDAFLSGLMAHLEFGPPRIAGIFEKMLLYCTSESVVADYRNGGLEATVNQHPLCRWVADHASGVIVTSEHARALLTGAGQVRSARCRVTNLQRSVRQISDEEKRSAREALGIAQSAVLVCSLGYMNDRKLSVELVDAWNCRDPQISARLVLVGEAEAGYGKVLREKIESSIRSPEVQMSGYVSEEDFERYLRAADIAVQLRAGSRGETSGAALYAMASGVPLVASRHGSFAEIPDDACIHVDHPLNVEELAAVLDDLIVDSEKRSTIGRRGYEWIRDTRDPATIAHAVASAVACFNDRAIVRRRSTLAERTAAFANTIVESEREEWVRSVETRAFGVEPQRLGGDLADSIARGLATILTYSSNNATPVDVNETSAVVPSCAAPPQTPSNDDLSANASSES